MPLPLPETFSGLEALRPFLVKVQRERRTEAVFRLTDAAAELSTAQLHGALDLLLPWVQRSARHICRERSFIAVRCRLGYRDGLRLADAWLAAAPHALTARERTALDAALGLVREAQSRYALPSDQLRFLISALASRVRYATALPGRAACARRNRPDRRSGQLSGLQRRAVPPGYTVRHPDGLSVRAEPPRAASVEPCAGGRPLVRRGRHSLGRRT